jgi:hypothetical protein
LNDGGQVEPMNIKKSFRRNQSIQAVNLLLSELSIREGRNKSLALTFQIVGLLLIFLKDINKKENTLATKR